MKTIILSKPIEEEKEMTSKEFWQQELAWFLPGIIFGTIGAFAIIGVLSVLGV